MKASLKYGLIGLAITPIIILVVIYLVSFLFVLSFDHKATWREDLLHAYEISYMIITLILSGFQERKQKNNYSKFDFSKSYF